MSFAIKLKKARQERNLTQKELAEKIEVATGVIGDIERGSRNPSQNVAIKLSNFFNTDISYWTQEDKVLNTQEIQEKLDLIYKVCSGLDFVTTRSLIKDMINKGIITKELVFADKPLPIEFHDAILHAIKSDIAMMFWTKNIANEIENKLPKNTFNNPDNND